jgi:hypothetical protein
MAGILTIQSCFVAVDGFGRVVIDLHRHPADKAWVKMDVIVKALEEDGWVITDERFKKEREEK